MKTRRRIAIAVTAVVLLVVSLELWTPYHKKRTARAQANAKLFRVCQDSERFLEASFTFIEPPALVAAEMGNLDCVAYVKAIMSPEVEQQLAAVRQEIIAKAAP